MDGCFGAAAFVGSSVSHAPPLCLPPAPCPLTTPHHTTPNFRFLFPRFLFGPCPLLSSVLSCPVLSSCAMLTLISASSLASPSSFLPSLPAPPPQFELYVSPPRAVLKATSTLSDAGLVPAALVYVSWRDVPPTGETATDRLVYAACVRIHVRPLADRARGVVLFRGYMAARGSSRPIVLSGCLPILILQYYCRGEAGPPPPQREAGGNAVPGSASLASGRSVLGLAGPVWNGASLSFGFASATVSPFCWKLNPPNPPRLSTTKADLLFPIVCPLALPHDPPLPPLFFYRRGRRRVPEARFDLRPFRNGGGHGGGAARWGRIRRRREGGGGVQTGWRQQAGRRVERGGLRGVLRRRKKEGKA